jgi:hypothetical protein
VPRAFPGNFLPLGGLPHGLALIDPRSSAHDESGANIGPAGASIRERSSLIPQE